MKNLTNGNGKLNNEFCFLCFLGAASGTCSADDLDCVDNEGLEAIRSLHRQLDDDDNGDIDLSESDDVIFLSLCYQSFIFST